MSPEEIQSLFIKYSSQMHVSINEHIQQKIVAVAQSIAGRKKVYLDTCYWIYLRDAELNRPKIAIHSEILKEIRLLVSQGKVVCPVSDVTFIELCKQSDDRTRMAVANLCDEFSTSVALQTEEYRANLEIETFIRNPDESLAVVTLLDKVWTKPGFIFGQIVPYNEEINKEQLLIIQKLSVDAFWDTTFSEITETPKPENNSLKSFDEIAANINIDKVKYEHEIPTIKKAFMSEIAGVIPFFKDRIIKTLVNMCEERGFNPVNINEEDFNKYQKIGINMIVNAFDAKQKKIGKRLPTLYIKALCHAAVRFDKSRKFSGNTLLDLHHGTAGVAYFDAMFTERPLRVLLTSGNVNLNEVFTCQIFSEEEQVLDYLRSIPH